ncbi:Endonuclease/exonuclease/phosphatase [Cubamyces menziesii]|nr:Endonuclease/exonuclease/phosphatase [Cubamyces menziesii]
MAPKRAAAKRKAASPSEDDLTPSESEHQSPSDHEDEPVAKKRKTAGPSKAKTKATAGTKGKTQGQSKGKGKAENQKPTGGETGTSSIAAEDGRQPTNKVLPVHIAFAPKAAEDTVRIAAWNICGLAAAQKKGFKYYVEAEDPDVLILTETKVNNDPVDPALTQRFPYRYWSISDKKTYSGTAILSKVEPISVDYTLPGHPDPKNVKGRIVTLEFASCYLVGTYVVNAGTGLKTLDEKKVWNAHFEAYIRQLDKKKPVIWAGDLNVAPTEIDLANPKTNWNKTPGYTEAETSSFARILNASGEEADAGKFVDVWRDKHPGLRHYTYFSYRFNCREKGLGWRLDMFVVSERMAERVQMCEIRSEIYGASDHCPVVLELKGPL